MGYIIAIIAILVILPLLIVTLSRRSTGRGGIDAADHGVTPDRPAADEPTPRPGPGVDRHIPPS